MTRSISMLLFALIVVSFPSKAQDPRPPASPRPGQAAAAILMMTAPSQLFNRVENGSLDAMLELKPAQIATIQRIDQLTRKCMIRLADDINLNAEDPARGMVARRRAIIDAAEMVVIQGVFTPEQADAYQGLLWKVKGFEALLEPQVAERLGLSRRQRQELSRRIAERRSGSETATAALGGLLKSTVPGEGPNALNMMKSSADDLERRVWAVLTPAQLGKWESLTRSKPEVLSRRRN